MIGSARFAVLSPEVEAIFSHIVPPKFPAHFRPAAKVALGELRQHQPSLKSGGW
jgi:hypothetical protein